jgi:beta-phosphoglucomutase-like phosphatase (HAD superfamily)
VETIAAVMLEPVGCLAEFRADEFDRAARELFGSTAAAAASGSEAYWRLVGFFEAGKQGDAALARLEALELAAVEQADLYEDVRPSLERLRATGVNVHLVSSLSRRAVTRFIERFALADLFDASVAREDAVGAMPLRYAIDQAALDPARCIYLVDTPPSLAMAKQVGVNAILMINDYDEGRALAEQSPSGGIVSLAELTDALQLIEQRSGLRSVGRMPLKPFELFEPG